MATYGASSIDDHQDSVLRKRKIKISNRESATGSRVRKKKHVDDLVAQMSELVSDNKYMAINLKDTTHMFLKTDFENSVLRAQLAQLTHQFESLNEIINDFHSSSDNQENGVLTMCGVNDEFLVHCNNMVDDNNQHLMVDMFMN